MGTRRHCSPRFPRNRSVATVGAIGLALLINASVPLAHAEGIDQEFLDAVEKHEINFDSPQSEIAAGHEVCDQLDQGSNKGDAATDIANRYNLDGYHAGFFVGLSVAAYCPWHHTTP